MNTWKDPKKEKPLQGLKILCMHAGDFYVAQRLGDYWFSISFADSKYSRYFPPDLWQNINFPIGFNGKLMVLVDGQYRDLDELEKRYPAMHQQMIEIMLSHFKNGMKNSQQLPE
jgi:hypothetical protein